MAERAAPAPPMNESLSELRAPEVDYMNGDAGLIAGVVLIALTLVVGMIGVWWGERKTKRAKT